MSKKIKAQEIELLAPAKDAQTAIDAINHGADAVYMGASKFGARALAGNSIEDMARVADYAHKFNAKLYATVNTIVYDDELLQVEKLVKDLYNGGIDALIVQDMSLLRLDIPPIALHSSTQCDLRTPEKARFLSSLGFSQLVMARELCLDEIKNIHAATDAKLEAFIYGALCVSYSGRCQVSQVLKGRSANRGACAQMCRMPYDLIDDNGNVIVENRHLLSLRDMNQSSNLLKLIEAGVSSFKIEGRLKDPDYVKNSVAYFRRELDEILDANSDKYKRSSCGTSTYSFTPNLTKCFNRSFTTYFLNDRTPANGTKMASLLTPKSMGEKIGKVIRCRGNQVKIDGNQDVHNGDGLSYFDGQEFTGFRVNRADGNTLVSNSNINIAPGTVLYRTYDKLQDDSIGKSQTARKLAIDATLRTLNDTIVLDLKDERGNYVSQSLQVGSLEQSQSDQSKRQIEALSKLGGTVYVMNKCDIQTNVFIPASLLSTLKRDAIALLDATQQISYRTEQRGKEDYSSMCYTTKLVSADNVANYLAEQVYKDHGVTEIERAVEVTGKTSEQQPVMHTRYCIRRELGACKKSGNAKALPDKIYLRNGNNLLAVDCDCKNCEMKLRVVHRK